MRLHDLKPRPGAKHRRKRLGAGESSGHGKTSGRGGKGQTARSGSSIRIGFEGGQMPLYRRIPKRGFNNAQFATQYLPVNVGDLEKFENNARIDAEAIRKAGLANGHSDGVKILGAGELTKKLIVSAHAFSASARTKIEARGGSCEVVGAKGATAPAAPAKAERARTAPAKAEAEGAKAPKAKPAKKESKAEKSSDEAQS